jgi:AGCS family alanine or glycine:cation symporter
MGNIAGVAVAISVGGPGAIFWMWVSGIIGMVTKFFTGSLSVMYRKQGQGNKLEGGVMYYIEIGLGKSWKPLAIFFAIAGLIGALPVFNVNQFTQAFNDIILQPIGIEPTFKSNLSLGILLLIITTLVTIGGLQRIGRTTERLVPVMVIIYFVCVSIIILTNLPAIPSTINLIFSEAFDPQFYKGEAFLGGSLGGLILLGVRRGAFSNEAGIGTATLAHGASNRAEPIEEGLIAMLGPFIDTLFICTLTAVAILITGVWTTGDANGVSLTNLAFTKGIPGIGSYLLMLCIAVFSISSLFSYSYYGTKCMAYLFGDKWKNKYHWLYLPSIILGCTATLDSMINLIDGFFALMALPTMVATIFLAPKVVKAARRYFS